MSPEESIVTRFAKETRANPHEAEAIYNTNHKNFSFPPRVGLKGMREVVKMMQQQKGRENEDFSLPIVSRTPTAMIFEGMEPSKTAYRSRQNSFCSGGYNGSVRIECNRA